MARDYPDDSRRLLTSCSCLLSGLGAAIEVTARSSDTFCLPTFPPGARQVHGVRATAAALSPPPTAERDDADGARRPTASGARTTKAVFPVTGEDGGGEGRWGYGHKRTLTRLPSMRSTYCNKEGGSFKRCKFPPYSGEYYL